MWSGFAAGMATYCHHRGLVTCCEQEGQSTAKDTVTSPEKERVMPHQEVKNRMLTCQHTQGLSLTWNEVLWNGGETVLVLSWALAREDHRQGHRDITGKGKGYAASGSEGLYVDLFQHKISFSHLEQSPMIRRWDCSCAIPNLLQGSVCCLIACPRPPEADETVGESLYETSRTLCQIKNHLRKKLGMWQEKIGQWGPTKDKIQDDQVTMTLPNTGRWNRRREEESSKQKSEWKRQIKNA